MLPMHWYKSVNVAHCSTKWDSNDGASKKVEVQGGRNKYGSPDAKSMVERY